MRLTLLLLFLLSFLTGYSQPSKAVLKKHEIGNSGCTAYNYCEPKYKLDFSSDSSKVFTGECINGGVTYGVICIQLLNPVSDPDIAEKLMIKYADYLKESFSIVKWQGYSRGYLLNKDENTRGIMDSWEDSDQDKWKIKAWTDGKYIGFMYAYSSKELPESKVNVFLDGFRLAGQ